MTERGPVPKDDSILIVGAGVFGLTTALELKRRGYEQVTVIDRYLPPVVDGSSVDISRVIRLVYADDTYGKMAAEAYQGWTNEYSQNYYESGFTVLANSPGNPYIEKSKEITESLGQTLDVYDDANDLRQRFPCLESQLDGLKAYVHAESGWADAEASIRQLSVQCSLEGVSFVSGPQGRVTSLLSSGNRVIGVSVTSGDTLFASQVILATGAWTNRLLPLSHAMSASGHPVGFIRLTPEETKKFKDLPIIMNFSIGDVVFPPTEENNTLKVAKHGFGFATSVSADSTGRTFSSPKFETTNIHTSYIPDDAEEELRALLNRHFPPEIANREWSNLRFGWYSDTPQGDFIIDHHPSYEGLFLATGGSGHAFKFLPVLGKYVTDCFENKAPQALREKWRLRMPSIDDKEQKEGDGSRAGRPIRTLTRAEQARL